MARSEHLAQLFQQPLTTAQRHYEICRGYFLEHATAEELAERYQLHVASVRALVRDFAQQPDLNRFFQPVRRGRKTAPKRQAIIDRACELRRRGNTLEEIRIQLASEGHPLSASYLFRVLQRAGRVDRTPPRPPPPPPGLRAKDGSEVPPIAALLPPPSSSSRRFLSQAAGLFLFVPQLLRLDLPAAVADAGWPGSEQIPPLQALLALLAPKLLGQRRISHINDLCCDEGAGLFAGLTVLPKTTYATDFSYRTDQRMHERLLAAILAKTPLGDPPQSFNLDFHAIPFRGHDADLENHWVPRQNRGVPAVMAFVAQVASRRVLCYATANVLRSEAETMVPRFAEYWKEQTGHYPARLLFDSRATTYAGLHELTQRCVGFITIRRRGAAMLTRVSRLPASSWQRCQITQAKGKRRQVQYVDEQVRLDGYTGSVRQLIVTGLGHESATFFLTNDYPERQTAREVIQTYASRNHVENELGEQITFFHLDCLCSDVRLNVNFDLTLTVVASVLYRDLAGRLKGFAQASPAKMFRKFVDTPGSIEVTAQEIVVRLVKRSHHPLLREAGLTAPTQAVPWLGGRSVRIECP
jgi:hypothetical protein